MFGPSLASVIGGAEHLSYYHTLRSVWANSQVVFKRTRVHNFDIDPETECTSHRFHVMLYLHQYHPTRYYPILLLPNGPQTLSFARCFV
jgi:hypothetical protein